MKKNEPIALIFIFITLIGLISISGCGRKAWPTAVAREDSFSFANVGYTHKKKCLEIKGDIVGNPSTLRYLVLEVEFKNKNTCIKCPFVGQKKIIFSRNNLNLHIKGHSFVLTYCKEGEKQVERFRLLGINKFSTIRPVSSNIVIVK